MKAQLSVAARRQKEQRRAARAAREARKRALERRDRQKRAHQQAPRDERLLGALLTPLSAEERTRVVAWLAGLLAQDSGRWAYVRGAWQRLRKHNSGPG